jgi:hypothetical protein
MENRITHDVIEAAQNRGKGRQIPKEEIASLREAIQFGAPPADLDESSIDIDPDHVSSQECNLRADLPGTAAYIENAAASNPLRRQPMIDVLLRK